MKNSDLWTFPKQMHFIPGLKIFLLISRVSFSHYYAGTEGRRKCIPAHSQPGDKRRRSGGRAALRFGRPIAGKDRVHFVQGAG